MERHHLPIRQSHHQSRSPQDIYAHQDGRRSLAQHPTFPHDGRASRRLGSQHGPPTRMPTQTTISLEDGISDLYDAVDDAIQHFSHFEQEFHQDIHRIQAYCDPPLLEAVWMQKIHPHENKARDHHQRDTYRGRSSTEQGHGGNRNPPSIRHTMRQLLSSLDAALVSAEAFQSGHKKRPTRYSAEDAHKIRQQLHRSYQSLRKSLSVLVKKSSEIESLNTELEMLRVFLSRNGGEQGRYGHGGAGTGGAGGGGGYARVPDWRREGGVEEGHDGGGAWDGPGEQEQTQGWGGEADCGQRGF